MTQNARIPLIDFLRGIALIAMTVFHFAFDLQLFGFREPGFIEQPHWKYFARTIATSFLFLTGFGLFLAHKNGVNWRKWKWRMGKIIAAALLITIATRIATPGQFIFFGILHQIAFSSLVCLLFLRVHAAVIIAISAMVFWAGQTLEFSLLNAPVWWWTGLSEYTPTSSDYVPVFPWFSASLAGIAVAKLAEKSGVLRMLAIPTLEQTPSRAVRILGQNSLTYYLLHQPILIGGILIYLFLTGNITL